MSLRRVVPALLLLAAALALVLPATADVRVRIVRLSYLDGDVQIDRRDGQGFEHAMLNLPVVQGTRLWAREEGLAEIELEDGSTIRLTPHTLIEAQELALRGGRTINLFDMQEGTAYLNIHGDDDDNFLLTLPGHQLRLLKSSRLRVIAERNEIRISVFKGEVEVSGQATPAVRVRKGETLSLDPMGGDGRYFLSRDIIAEYYDTWDEEREEYRRTYARHNSYSGYRDVYYGVHDLHYWGNYVHVPTWGYVWRPYYVGTGWNPWLDGAWVWYPGWGYTWVSAYPWGWVPYHYGSWIWINNYGWCWQPGGWSSWSHFARVRHAPRGFVAPLPPRHGGGRVVVVGNGGRTVYPREDRGFLGTLRDAKNAANQPTAGTGGIPTRRSIDRGRTSETVGSGGGGTVGGRTVVDRTDLDSRRTDPRTDADARTGNDSRGDTARTGQWTPRQGRTVMDSRQDDLGGRSTVDSRRDAPDRGGATTTRGADRSGGTVQRSSPPPARTSAPDRSAPRDSSPPPARTSPSRDSSPPPARTSPSRDSSPSSSPSMRSNWSRPSGGSSARSSAPSSGSSAGRRSSARTSRSPN